MDTSLHSMTTLFQQLGLPHQDSDIEGFIAQHRLEKSQALAEASFWNANQARFLKEALEDDADWAEVVDQLDARLRY
ncbi:DUF2789 domain-containing protein [Aestuariicella hydrocarbonica]|uniref:DUF2789 domain-containing protein n=1 Tax=Pseudomaricurvus hydrocarbonicus TaxID=1470433 RepID=A0A9E5MJH5_9GAMM|nr:DUF2789 domain-containing protein [Aestuariicella hydrocarbonica]NHO65139.1 DUF2789 domain-containing protein [Aestuariicella hydrocarbonica]